MKELIKKYFTEKLSEFTEADRFQMYDFVKKFLESDEYYMLRYTIDKLNEIEESRINLHGSKNPEADLFRLCGRQSIKDYFNGVIQDYKTYKEEEEEKNKQEEENKKFDALGGSVDELSTGADLA